MKGFIKRMIYRWRNTPQIVYECEKCGSWNLACPECHNPTKVSSQDPYEWQCLKCKKKFRIYEIQEANYFFVDENKKLIPKKNIS